jgi:hypothetical protein
MEAAGALAADEMTSLYRYKNLSSHTFCSLVTTVFNKCCLKEHACILLCVLALVFFLVLGLET